MALRRAAHLDPHRPRAGAYLGEVGLVAGLHQGDQVYLVAALAQRLDEVKQVGPAAMGYGGVGQQARDQENAHGWLSRRLERCPGL